MSSRVGDLRIRVLVDQAAEPLASVDDTGDRWLRGGSAGRRGLAERAVWSVAVVVSTKM
jgi:hypothetical protein